MLATLLILSSTLIADLPEVQEAEAASTLQVQDDKDQKSAQNNPLKEEMNDSSDAAVSRGIAFLATQQLSDGSFGMGRFERHVGVTALGCLALMADGHIPGRGEHGEAVQKGLEFVLANCTETGFIEGATTSHGPMYGHGFATLFLGEIFGMNPADERVHDALVRATQVIINSQNDDGGWRYRPIPVDADISVTICQIMALRSARNAGIKIPKETIDLAVEYVRSCQNADGGFRYMVGVGGSGWPRTAAGVASLFYAGIYEDEAIKRGLDYLLNNVLPGGRTQTGEAHYFYGHYYAVQAMYLAGGEYWGKWWPAIRDELVQAQSTNGSWPDHYSGGAYGTAMSLIILQMPKRYLPIFQK